jgi:hypothetical protein
MAIKKTAGKSKALVPWSEKFANYAKAGKEQVKKAGGGGASIKFGRGSIQVSGATVPGGKLKCVILGSCAHNRYFAKDFDKDDIQPPDCYAYAIEYNDPEMAPHPEALSKQAELCADCENFQFGTAKTGRGKACAQGMRIGALVATDCVDAEDIPRAEMATGFLSPTNVKHWKGYVDMLADEEGLPTWAVVTEITTFDDPDTQIRVEFALHEKIEDDAILTEIEKRADVEKLQSGLQVPYGPKIERQVRPKGKAVGVGKKFAANVKGRR